MVSELKKPYVAKVSIGDGKGSKHLGYFSAPSKAHKVWQLAKADVIEETVSWWKMDEATRTYREDIAEALIERAYKLRYDASHNIETVEL